MSWRAWWLLAVVPFAAWADCREWSWSVFPPPGAVVPSNARFVVQGFGVAQDVVKTMASRHPRLVTANGESFPLKVAELHVSEFHLTQVVLQARGALTAGTVYTLRFDQPEGPEAFELSKSQVPSWIVGPVDFEPPRWSSGPTAMPGVIKAYGCGPLVEARVAVGVTDAYPVLLRARVKGEDAGVREYLLTPQDAEIAIGHNMCSGAFDLGEGEWTLELQAVDLAGNTAAAPGEPLRFKGVDPVR